MISVYGRVVADITKDPITLKSGEVFQVRVLSFNDGLSQFNLKVEVPVSTKLVVDKNGMTRVDGLVPSRIWDKIEKRFVPNIVSYYLPRTKV